jgi:hypothetical protein
MAVKTKKHHALIDFLGMLSAGQTMGVVDEFTQIAYEDGKENKFWNTITRLPFALWAVGGLLDYDKFNKKMVDQWVANKQVESADLVSQEFYVDEDDWFEGNFSFQKCCATPSGKSVDTRAVDVDKPEFSFFVLVSPFVRQENVIEQLVDLVENYHVFESKTTGNVKVSVSCNAVEGKSENDEVLILKNILTRSEGYDPTTVYLTVAIEMVTFEVAVSENNIAVLLFSDVNPVSSASFAA